MAPHADADKNTNSTERIEVLEEATADSDTITTTPITNPPHHTDKAAQFLASAAASNECPPLTPAANAALLRRIDWHILPILLTIYALQSLDKTTLSYASVFGLIDDTHLVGDQYSWLGSIVYVAQLVVQPLVAVVLVKAPVGRVTAGMLFVWGAVLCGMSGATAWPGLVGCRFLLGAAEGGVAPAFIAIVQMWYRRGEQTNRNAAWYAMLGVVNMFGSLLSYGLGHINSSHLYSYQIIFLFCGLLTVLFSIIVFLYLPDTPMTARFLTPSEKLLAIERLRANQMGVSSTLWRWAHVRESLRDAKTYLWFSMILLISIPSGGVSTFGPLIVESFGFSSFTTILFNIPFGAVQLVATLGGAWVATRWRVKSAVMLALCAPPIAGLCVLLRTPYATQNRATLLVGYYLISFYPGITPLIYSWSAQNTAGDTKKKVTTGVLFVGASAGNIIGPHLFNTDEAPRYTRGLVACLAIFVALGVVVAAAVGWVWVLNRWHARMRVERGKGAKVVDRSMGEVREEDKLGVEEVEMVEGGTGEVVEDKGFADETDLRNEDFIYLY